MNKRTLRIAGWALGLSLALGGVGAAVGASRVEPIEAKADQSYSHTWSKADLSSCLDGDYTDASSYWKVPSEAGKNATITLPFGSDYSPTGDLSVSFHIATFGGGSNPSNSNTTISAVDSDTGSVWSGSNVSSYPSSSSYVDGIMTIALQSKKTISGLQITMGVDSDVRIFRLQTITVTFDYAVTADHTISTATSGLSLSGDLAVNNGQPAEVVLTTQQKKKITAVSLTGAGTEGENWDYDSTTRTVTILSVTSDVVISAAIENAPVGSIAVTGQKTTFTVGDAFSFGGTVVATYDDDAAVHGTKTLSSSEYSVDSSGFDSSSAKQCEIVVTCGSVEFRYNVTIRKIEGEIPSGKYFIFTDNGALSASKITAQSGCNDVQLSTAKAWDFDLVDDNTYTISTSAENKTWYLYVSSASNTAARANTETPKYWTLNKVSTGLYELIMSDGSDNRWLCDYSNNTTNDYRTYKSSAKGEMYKLKIVEEKVAFGEYFTTNFTCSGVTPSNPDGAITASNPATLWSTLSTFKGNLSSAAQDVLKTAPANLGGNSYEQALARYDLIIRKYTTSTYTDFLGRFSQGGANYGAFSIARGLSSENPSLPLIVAVIGTGLAAAGGLVFLHRRNRKED